MIDLIVKTLDSQNHSFSVADDITVKEFKDIIAEKIEIAPDSQRLIYCGRVLLDEKNLSEYDVNGKVIHLVQRPPPSQTASPSRSSRSGSSHRRSHHANGNSVFLEAVGFPDFIDLQVPPSHRVSSSRYSVIRRMLNRITAILNRLENPNEGTEASDSPPNENESGDNDILNQDLSSSIAQAAQTATAAAFAAAMSSAHTSRVLPNITIVRANQTQPLNLSQGRRAASQDRTQTQSQPQPQAQAQAQGPAQAQARDSSTSNPNETSSTETGSQEPGNERPRSEQNNNRRILRTSVFADHLDEFENLADRVEPFMTRFREMLHDDAPYEDPTEAQRVFNGVSEILHCMAHAYHTLSDVMCDFSQPPPRSLRFRPLLIQQSAVLQAGIPVLQFGLNRNSGNAPASSGSNSSTSTSTSTSQTSQTTATTEANSTETAPPPPRETAAADTAEAAAVPSTTNGQATTTTTGTDSPQPQPQPQPRHANVYPSVLNLAPNNLEFFMEFGPNSITIDSVEASIQRIPGSNAQNEPNAPQVEGGGFPIPSPEVLQSLVEAVAEHVMLQVTTTVAVGTGTPAPGQNVQARGNTATNPTTSTQTRSTPRPHVHLGPATAVTGLGSQNFDPFLPCASHHIRVSRRRTPAASQTTERQNQQTETAPAEPPPREPVPEPEPPSQETPSQSNPIPVVSLPEIVSRILNVLNPPSGSSTNLTVNPQPSINLGGLADLNLNQNDPLEQLMFGSPDSLTLADLVQSYSGEMYTEGESLSTDLIMALARVLTFQDFVSLNFGRMECLNRLRPHLREFITQRLLQGESLTSESRKRAVDKMIEELNIFFDVIKDSQLRDDIDLKATVEHYHRMRLSEVIDIIMREESDGFDINILQWCKTYLREITAIVVYCCTNGAHELGTIIERSVSQLTEGLGQGIRRWTVRSSQFHILNYLTDLDVPLEDIQQYLVYKETEKTNEPMEVETEQEAEAEPIIGVQTPIPSPMSPSILTYMEAADSLPDLIIGSEAWHASLPREWVPIISRDSQRQRRQSPQLPFSDAYLNSMPTKRRKLLSSAKNRGNMDEIISEIVRHAVNASGVDSSLTETVCQAAEQDSSIKAACRKQVHSTVSENIINNSDFLPERFPNTMKYFSK